VTESDTPKRPARTALWVGLVALVAVAGLVGLVWWALARTSGTPAPAARPSFERYRAGWESAMAKASVEATFPAGPVDIREVRPTGLQPFNATFTDAEITALLNTYTFTTEIAGTAVTVSDVDVTFPRAGVAQATARVATGPDSYSVDMTIPLQRSATGIDSPGATSLSVEGFSVKGQRREQASEALVAYLNLYVRAAPGLIVERAEIVNGGLAVTGSAPVKLEHPEAPSAP